MQSRNPPVTGNAPTVRAQFFHIEAYGLGRRQSGPRAPGEIRKGRPTIDEVVAELVRHPGASPHVKKPESPELIHGTWPLHAAAESKAWAATTRRAVAPRPGTRAHTRKLRHDSPAALVGIVSCPPDFGVGRRWQVFKKKAVRWLVRQYGSDRLRSVVEHVDEGQPHLHFWVVPRRGDPFNTVHDGFRARDAVGLKSRRALRDAAYKRAMSALQDAFHSGVGRWFGFQRTSVNGKRVSPDQWGEMKVRRQAEDEALRLERARSNELMELERAAHRAEVASLKAMLAAKHDREELRSAAPDELATLRAENAQYKARAAQFKQEDQRLMDLANAVTDKQRKLEDLPISKVQAECTDLKAQLKLVTEQRDTANFRIGVYEERAKPGGARDTRPAERRTPFSR